MARLAISPQHGERPWETDPTGQRAVSGHPTGDSGAVRPPDEKYNARGMNRPPPQTKKGTSSDIREIQAEPAVAPDRGGIAAFRDSTSHQPPRQVNGVVRRLLLTRCWSYDELWLRTGT